MKRLVPNRNLLIVIGTCLIYLITFLILFDQVGENIVALSMMPMLIAGWYFGWAGGLITTVLLVSTNTVLFYLSGADGLAMVVNQGPGLLVAVLLAVSIGWIRRMWEQQRAQAMALQREREALIREIEARQRVEHALLEAKDAAEAASRAKSTFLSSISHELRTPLTVILGFCELALLEAQQQGQAQIQHDIEKIQQSGKHLLQLINTVLDLSKIEAGKLEIQIELVPLRTMVAEVELIAAQLMLAQQNQLRIIWDTEVDLVLADATRLRQLLINLLGNAAKFTIKGVVTLRIADMAREPQAERGAAWSGDAPAHRVHTVGFEISDTGIGIPAHLIPNLFEPFTQVSGMLNHQPGTGLGLAISRHFCRLMGGDLRITSVEGQGTTVSFDLKAAPQPKETDYAHYSDR